MISDQDYVKEVTSATFRAVQRNEESHLRGDHYFVDRGWKSKGPYLATPYGDPLVAAFYDGSYSHHLPTWRGKDAKQLSQAAISRFGKATILDVGCGNGAFLLDFQTDPELKGNIHCDGITSYPYHRASWINRFSLWRSGVHIETGDINNLSEESVIKRRYYNLITLVKTLQHLADPLNALSKIYDRLAPDGICLVSFGQLHGIASFEARKRLYQYLTSQYQFEVQGDPVTPYVTLAFCRTKPRLELPVIYRLPDQKQRAEIVARLHATQELTAAQVPRIWYDVLA